MEENMEVLEQTAGTEIDSAWEDEGRPAAEESPEAAGPGAAKGRSGRAGGNGRDAGGGLLQRARQQARRQDMERFLQAFPQVKAEAIPRQVWEQVARGMPLVSAYAMHENERLRVELAAERQDRTNRLRTPGALGGNSGGELDEMDRMWAEED